MIGTTSVFGDKIFNRSHLLFVIEDTEGNIFGVYVTSTIEKYNNRHDVPHAFFFSLKSKKRFIGMRKFPIVDPSCGISVDLKSNKTFLFVIGNVDIWVNKKDEEGSYFSQNSFHYLGMKSGLCGSRTEQQHFPPKIITVIQMK